MTPYSTLSMQIPAGLGIGLVYGWVHFWSLRCNVRLMTGGAPVKAFMVQLVRLACVAGVFFLLTRLGPWALLSGALALLPARLAVLRQVKRTSGVSP